MIQSLPRLSTARKSVETGSNTTPVGKFAEAALVPFFTGVAPEMFTTSSTPPELIETAPTTAIWRSGSMAMAIGCSSTAPIVVGSGFLVRSVRSICVMVFDFVFRTYAWAV